MTDINITKRTNRKRRHARGRALIAGTAERPRVTVFKSNRHIFVQVIDDAVGRTLASGKSAVAVKKTKTAKAAKATKTDVATKIGTAVAEQMKKNGITKAVFDKAGFKYHGRVKAIAEAMRAAGITL